MYNTDIKNGVKRCVLLRYEDNWYLVVPNAWVPNYYQGAGFETEYWEHSAPIPDIPKRLLTRDDILRKIMSTPNMVIRFNKGPWCLPAMLDYVVGPIEVEGLEWTEVVNGEYGSPKRFKVKF